MAADDCCHSRDWRMDKFHKQGIIEARRGLQPLGYLAVEEVKIHARCRSACNP